MKHKYVYHVQRLEDGSRQEYPFKTLASAIRFISNSEKRKLHCGSYEIYRVKKSESWTFTKEQDQ